MSAKPAAWGACAVADATHESPVYYALPALGVARMVVEQPVVRAGYIGDEGFSRHAGNGARAVEISLEGPSMGSAGESILRAALLGQTRCLVRLDSAQGERMAGEFWVTRFEQIADAEALERLRVSLRSHGPVTVTAL